MTNNNTHAARRKDWRRAGFTLAEMLIVVAIIGVLSGVAFVAVQSHQKSLHRAEMDSIAKEIFVAAQNHLLMAENENYLGSTEYGTPLSGNIENNEDGIFFFSVKEGSGFSANNNLLDQMLPFGSVDETVRAGGSYIIFYQPEAALVLDVLYTDGDYTFAAGDRAEYAGDGKRSNRANKSPILGWYGSYGVGGNESDGAATIAEGTRLKQPAILVENAEKLRVTVTDLNKDIEEEGISLVLVVSELDMNGNETGEKKAIKLRVPSLSTPDSEFFEEIPDNGVYKIILDDITTSGKHFVNVKPDTNPLDSFTPGCNISIQAIAYNTTKVTNIAYSDEEITNSLFESISVDAEGVVTASINNIRHFENLEEEISGLAVGKEDGEINLKKAVQTSDISWSTFKGKLNGINTQVYPYGSSAIPTTADCFMTVSPGYVLSYDGQNHNVYDIKVSSTGACGLFGTVTKEGTEIKNLALHDFSITATDDTGMAGALAGSMNNVTVTNVVAYNTGVAKTPTITASGSTGGLIGSATNCTIQKSAAALIVNSTAGNAGGLIGTSSRGSVTASYSGGHTEKAEYYNHSGEARTTAIYNVTGGTYAGGLIGNAGNTEINQCYSTCSTEGTTTGAKVGGLIGTGSGAISHSYCTGLVSGTNQGAFAGEYTGSATDNVRDCLYFEIINEIPAEGGGFRYLKAVGDADTPNITAFDTDAATYDGFSWPGGATECPWKDANVYDKTLITYYGKTGTTERTARYNLQTVEQLLGASLKTDDDDTTEYFVATHYGDWPAPEIFVVNVPTP